MKINDKNIKAAYEVADDNTKKVLSKLFPEQLGRDDRPVTERIKTFDDAVRELWETHEAGLTARRATWITTSARISCCVSSPTPSTKVGGRNLPKTNAGTTRGSYSIPRENSTTRLRNGSVNTLSVVARITSWRSVVRRRLVRMRASFMRMRLPSPRMRLRTTAPAFALKRMRWPNMLASSSLTFGWTSI